MGECCARRWLTLELMPDRANPEAISLTRDVAKWHISHLGDGESTTTVGELLAIYVRPQVVLGVGQHRRHPCNFTLVQRSRCHA